LYEFKKKHAMADNKKNIGNPDRSRINVNEQYELNDWSRKFRVTPEQLKKAVKEVGSIASDVEAHLKKSTATAGKK
jgi:hypothetical protein